VVAAAENDFNAYGLGAVAYTYPGLWFNRDPYQAYKALQLEQRLLSSAGSSPLKKLPGLSVSALRECEWQAELFSGVTEGCFDNLDASEHHHFPMPPAPVHVPLPLQSLEHARVTVKLLHNKDTKPVSSKYLLNHLRELKRPVVFSLIAQPESAYFQLSFATEEQAFIERQLRLYFPTLAVVPSDSLQAAFADRSTLHSITARSQFMYLPLKGSGDLHLHPYSQVLSAVAGSHRGSTALVEVYFQPVGQHAITTISDQLTAYSGSLQSYIEYLGSEAQQYRKDNERYFGSHPVWSDDKRDYEKHWDDYISWANSYYSKVAEVHRTHEFLLKRNPKLIQKAKKQIEGLRERKGLLQKKLPAWFASIRITSDDQALLEQVQRDFLSQFETTQQGWLLSGIQASRMLPHRIPRPSLYSTDELAGPVSFPSSQLAAISLKLHRVSSPIPQPCIQGQAFN
jgi:hypothetical protein